MQMYSWVFSLSLHSAQGNPCMLFIILRAGCFSLWPMKGPIAQSHSVSLLLNSTEHELYVDKDTSQKAANSSRLCGTNNKHWMHKHLVHRIGRLPSL